MFHVKPKERECYSWLFVGLWILSIYSAIPIARTFQKFVTENFGREFFFWLVGCYLGLFFLAAVIYSSSYRKQFSLSKLFWLLAVGTAFAVWCWNLRSNPERCLHFVQYGTLGILVYRALIHRVNDLSIFFAVSLFCGAIGTLDEIIQWVTPNRYFDYDDIAINFGAAALAQIGIYGGIRPSLVQSGIGISGASIVQLLFSVQILLLGLCLSNTPTTVHWYTEKFPKLTFLRSNPVTMAEYGYLHGVEFPEANAKIKFYSRLQLPELARLDRERAPTAGALLQEWKDGDRYESFLQRFPALSYPLEYEARVRLFRRDRYLGLARGAERSSDRYRWLLRTAYTEHLILNAFYPETYRQSAQQLTEADITEMRARVKFPKQLTSPVSSELITQFSLAQFWAIIVGLLLVSRAALYFAKKRV